MPVGAYCRRSVCTAAPDETIRDAAERMEKEGVGLLAVVEDGRPVGVLSDRDIALHALSGGGDRVADAMSQPVRTIAASGSLREAVDLMASERIRRLMVVDDEERALGVLAADDLVRLLSDEISGLAAVAAAQIPGASAPPTPAAEPEEPIAARPVEHYAKEVLQLRSDVPVKRAIEEMRKAATGCVVATDGEGEPVGIVTDRDVALRVVARGQDPELTVLSSIMSAPALSCESTQPLEELIARMRDHGVRRMPITREGRLAGMVTYDDLLVTLGTELQRLGSAVAGQVRREALGARAEDVRAFASEKLKDVTSQVGELGGEAARRIREEIDSLRDRLRRSDD
jgi:CBS domain-containing protein